MSESKNDEIKRKLSIHDVREEIRVLNSHDSQIELNHLNYQLTRTDLSDAEKKIIRIRILAIFASEGLIDEFTSTNKLLG